MYRMNKKNGRLTYSEFLRWNLMGECGKSCKTCNFRVAFNAWYVNYRVYFGINQACGTLSCFSLERTLQ